MCTPQTARLMFCWRSFYNKQAVRPKRSYLSESTIPLSIHYKRCIIYIPVVVITIKKKKTRLLYGSPSLFILLGFYFSVCCLLGNRYIFYENFNRKIKKNNFLYCMSLLCKTTTIDSSVCTYNIFVI